LGGETILIFSILAGQGIISFWFVLIFCTFGMFLSDLLWFSVGKIKFLSKMKKYKWIHASYKRAREEIEVAPSNKFLLILIKFAYGIAVPILMYLGRRKMTMKEFLMNEIPIVVIWSSAIIMMGWLIGKTSDIAFANVENIYTWILLVGTSLVLLHLVIRQIGKRIIYKTEHRKI
jgi:membrane protein DedA with SNARE-associated domain